MLFETQSDWGAGCRDIDFKLKFTIVGGGLSFCYSCGISFDRGLQVTL